MLEKSIAEYDKQNGLRNIHLLKPENFFYGRKLRYGKKS